MGTFQRSAAGWEQEHVQDYFKLFAVSAVVMGLAQTLTKEKIFECLRERLGGKETWLGYLVSCPYCASHYFAFLLVPLTGSYYLRMTPSWGVLSTVGTWFLSSVLVTVIAAFLRVGFWFVDETQALVRRRKQVVERSVSNLVPGGRSETDNHPAPMSGTDAGDHPMQ